MAEREATATGAAEAGAAKAAAATAAAATATHNPHHLDFELSAKRQGYK